MIKVAGADTSIFVLFFSRKHHSPLFKHLHPTHPPKKIKALQWKISHLSLYFANLSIPLPHQLIRLIWRIPIAECDAYSDQKHKLPFHFTLLLLIPSFSFSSPQKNHPKKKSPSSPFLFLSLCSLCSKQETFYPLGPFFDFLMPSKRW